MSSLRALRALKTRWWVVVLMALLGAGVALGAAELRNRGLEPVFEAVAPMSVLRLPEEKDAPFNRRVETVVAQARSITAERLRDANLNITTGESAGAVQFVATAPTSEAALQAARDLREYYLEARPASTAQDQLAPVLDALATEISLVEQELALLSGTGVTDPVTDAERAAILAQLQSAAQEAAALNSQLLDPALEAGERTDLENRLTAVDAVLESIDDRLAELPPATVTSGDTRTRLQRMVLEQRLRSLESQYVSAALREVEVGSEGLVGEPFVVDQTAPEISPVLVAIVGLMGGILLGGIAVAANDRIRLPVRSPDDVPEMALTEVDKRPRRHVSGPGWYAEAGGEHRRTHIQTLRAQLERFLERDAVLVVAGVGAAPPDVYDLAADLAASAAATGRTVLLVDTLFGEDLAPGSDVGSSLSDMLRTSGGEHPDRSDIKRSLWDRTEIASNLLSVPAGPVSVDIVDALAGVAFAMVVEEAREVVDVVIVSAPNVGTAAADAVASRTRAGVLVAEKDRTSIRDLTLAASHLGQLGVRVAATALLSRRSASGSSKSRPSQRNSVERRPDGVRRKRPRRAHLGE